MGVSEDRQMCWSDPYTRRGAVLRPNSRTRARVAPAPPPDAQPFRYMAGFAYPSEGKVTRLAKVEPHRSEAAVTGPGSPVSEHFPPEFVHGCTRHGVYRRWN